MTVTARPLEKGHAGQYPLLRTVHERHEKTQSRLRSRSHALRSSLNARIFKARYPGGDGTLRTPSIITSAYGSHALRGNPVRDAPASRTAERGNDEMPAKHRNSSFPRAAWERLQGALRHESWATSAYTGRSASHTVFPRSTWERGVLEYLCITMSLCFGTLLATLS